jgi:hypothetical protein
MNGNSFILAVGADRSKNSRDGEIARIATARTSQQGIPQTDE